MDDGNSLWERVCQTVNRLGGNRSPRVRVDQIPEPRFLDLHNMKVEEANRVTKRFIATATNGTITIVTGRSGVIRREFPDWLSQIAAVKSYRITNDDGAFVIKIRQ